MPLPKRDCRGKNFTVSMMELRRNPGEVFDLVAHGACVRVERLANHIATIVPAGNEDDEVTVIYSNGKIEGRFPLTLRLPIPEGPY